MFFSFSETMVSKLKKIKSRVFWINVRIHSSLSDKQVYVADDKVWFEFQLRPENALKYGKMKLPSLPPDDVQRRFTARSGKENLLQAFHFYKFLRETCSLEQINQPKILDFGGGWGRISRFFFRDTNANFIWIADCLADSIYWLNATGNPCNIIKNEPRPPIADLDTKFDLIYAFSVFSHLSEDYFLSWIEYLLDLLRPGGHLVFTTRGNEFLLQIEKLHHENISHYLTEKLPHYDEIRLRYDKGEFQFYPTGGGGELSSDFYGETIIPKSYMQQKFPVEFLNFTENRQFVDQAVIVLKKVI